MTHVRSVVFFDGPAFRSLDSVLAARGSSPLGESVHDVEEFMSVRFERLKHLVQERHATALIVESGLPEAIAIDDYILGRTNSV